MNRAISEFSDTEIFVGQEAIAPLHILIVEDVPEDLELILLTLEEANLSFTYEDTSTAIEYQRHLESEIYDVILSDYRLPTFNGLQAFELLQKFQPDIPFILITGSLGEEAAVDCIKAGMTDYILKDRLFRLPTVLQRSLQEFALRRQQKAAIAKIEQQAWRETIINRIVQSMRETLVLEDVLQTTADLLHEALQVDRCLIFQPDPNQEMRVRYLSKSTEAICALHGLTCSFFEYFHDLLVRGEQVVFSEIRDDLHPQVQLTAKEYSIQSILITPLHYRQSYFGAISLYQCDRERIWSENELSLVKAIADQCAIAIHQSELYQNAQIELGERKKMEAQLRHDALHDALTGLPNRALLTDRLNHALQLFQRRSRLDSIHLPFQFAVLFLDLDRFKMVNDSLGHAAGDRLLKIVAQRLNGCLRSGDTVARLSGDEFVVLLEEIEDINDALEVVENIDQILKEPIFLESNEIFVSSSIGIVMSSVDYKHPDQLLRDADTAMYRAKEKGRGRYEIFNRSMHIFALEQLHLENDLRRAIAKQEFIVYYQPIVCLNSCQILGFEALVRWQHPERNLISPSEFIPIAEDTGLIIPIDFWVLNEACRQLREWQNKLPSAKHLTINVNLSGAQFAHLELIAHIDRIIQSVNLENVCLKIEITESTLIENTNLAVKILSQLKDRNIQVCIDDFGTGYSSLSYLHRFPLHTLKIDRSYISQLDTNSADREIVKAIIVLGLNLGMNVVAEGIESLEQLIFLKNNHCHAGQGYYFSEPLAVEAATKLISCPPNWDLKP